MAYLEVIARAKVRPGQLEGVKAQAAEIVRVTREQDTHTLRCDWFLNEDGTECEVHEMFPDERGLIEHQMHIMEARTVLFRDYAYDHRSMIYAAVFVHLNGRALAFQSLIQSSSAVVSSSSEQNTPRSRQRRCNSANHRSTWLIHEE